MEEFNIQNRRYTGSKYKLISWIKEALLKYCKDCNSLFDVFGGTGIVTAECIELYDTFIINDFLSSNEIIYRGFLDNKPFNKKSLLKIKNRYQSIKIDSIDDNYFSLNFGDKYFSINDAKKIGYIRQNIEDLKTAGEINEKEFAILISSLIYSMDKVSNTVGHYEAFIKNKVIEDKFIFRLIQPIKHNKNISIFRCDSNELAKTVKADIAFIDPPYNSRQYSRFYHVLETVTEWKKPKLYGVAMKPAENNMSDYCRSKAPDVFRDLINNLNVKYIAVTYNNTYTSKSSSSQNKITLDQIRNILSEKGNIVELSHKHNAFNAGKTDLANHKEYLFICEVNK